MISPFWLIYKKKHDLFGDILVLYGVLSRDDMESELIKFHEIEGAKIEWEINVKSLRILVVDDEAVIRNILNQFLDRSGHNVKTVDNGTDAIKMVESEVFDLVLCDLGLPDVFGYDVVSAINRIEKRPKIGIISGWSVDRVSDKDMKIDFYLKKPFKHSELIKHIDELFLYN